MPYLMIFPLLIAAFTFSNFFDERDIKENAEFEAVHCPAMLQVDSEYCKPVGDK